MFIVVLLGGILFWVLYKYWISTYKAWELRGVPFIAASFPFGSSLHLALLDKFQGDSMDKLYKKAAPSPYFGIYILRVPNLVIRDPDIIRLVLSKGFSHFTDRMGYDVPKNDPLSHHLFNLEGERWRALRVKMNPAFTSGKLKEMFQLFISCSEVLENRLILKKGSPVDIKDLIELFTTDIIFSCAFGLKVNNKSSDDSQLRKIAATILSMRPKLLQRIMFRPFPSLMDYTPLRFLEKDCEMYLLNLIKDTVETRNKQNVKRHDFLDLLIELKERGKLVEEDMGELETDAHAQPIEMTTELMTAQCVLFFIAGYETSSSVQSYCLYELAVNPDIQEKVQKEITETIAKHGSLTYNAVQEMPYLDMIVHETLRKYPSLPILTRRCTKTFSMPAGNRIEKGDRIMIPVWSLHHDPDYFPDPDKFDPERFSSENKPTIKPFTYLPFGEGPRMCIGQQFGLLQTKLGLITFLKKYKVSPTEKTKIPLQFGGSILVTTTGPIILKISERHNT